MRKGLIAGALLLALAGCERAATPSETTETSADPDGPAALSGFAHRMEGDVSGTYGPVTPVRIEGQALQYLFIGQERDFRTWEDGEDQDGPPPVGFRFEPGAVRVAPSAYAVTDGALRFSGEHPTLGRITFEGDLDAGALAQSRRVLGGDGAPVLTGTLRVAGQTFENQSFSWRSGDEG